MQMHLSQPRWSQVTVAVVKREASEQAITFSHHLATWCPLWSSIKPWGFETWTLSVNINKQNVGEQLYVLYVLHFPWKIIPKAERSFQNLYAYLHKYQSCVIGNSSPIPAMNNTYFLAQLELNFD